METSHLTKDSSPPPHHLLSAGLIVLALISFIIVAAINGLAGSGAGVPDVFYSTVGDISDIFELFITPAGFTFTIWTIIYLWIAVSLVMFTVSIFLTNSYGRVYLSPPIMTPSVSTTFIINMVLNLAWIFVWDRSSVNQDLTILALVILLLTAISNVLVMTLLARNITANTADFSRAAPLFWWGTACRIVLNGLGIYTTWTVIASLINLTVVIVYPAQVDAATACIISLTLLVIIHTTWFVLENFFLDKFVRYLLTPYLVVIWASIGIYSKKSDDPTVPQEIINYVLAIIIIASLTLVIRLGIIIYRVLRKPLVKMSTVTSFNDAT